MLLRLAYLGITNAFALLRLLPGSDRDEDTEILALRHQLAVLQRQLGEQRIRFDPADRAWLAALLHQLPRPSLRRLRLLVRPDTVLRWHRDLLARRHAAASRPRRRGRPPTVRSIRTLVLRLVAENPSWGYRRVHGELLTLGIKVAASTVWEMLCEACRHRSRDEPTFIAPVQTWPVAAASPSGLAIVDNTLYMAALRGTRLWRMRITGNTTTDPQAYFTGTYGRLRTVEPSPDGGLWLATSNGGDKDSIPNNSDNVLLHVALNHPG
jgi:hypothetical protein